MLLPLLLLLLTASAAAAAQRTLTGKLVYTQTFPDRKACPIGARVRLDGGGQHEALIRQDGTFVLENVTPGLHTLAVHCPAFKFHPLLIAVPTEPEVRPFVAVHNPSRLPAFTLSSLPPAERSLAYPLELAPVGGSGPEDFFESAKGFDPASLLKNPLLLIGGLSAVLMLGLPYLTSQLDPELVKEAQAIMQPSSGGGGGSTSAAAAAAAPPAWGSSVGVGGAAAAGGGGAGIGTTGAVTAAAAVVAGGPGKRSAAAAAAAGGGGGGGGKKGRR